MTENQQQTLFGESASQEDDNEEYPTSEGYKFSNPQCAAQTSTGSRCLNAVEHIPGALTCPAHDRSDDFAIDIEDHPNRDQNGN